MSSRSTHIRARGAGERPRGRIPKIGAKRTVTVTVGAIASKILGVELVTRGSSSSASAERAIRCYLNDKESPSPGWAYPSFLRGRKPAQQTELELNLDAGLWRSLSTEALSQEVSAPQLLEHAVLYFAAEENAGRVTERILDDFNGE
jgi:hypothetical protein